MPAMFKKLEARGYGDCIERVGGTGPQALQPLMWRVVHEIDATYAENAASVQKSMGLFEGGLSALDPRDAIAGKWLCSGYAVPGPNEKSNKEYKSRTEVLENTAKRQVSDTDSSIRLIVLVDKVSSAEF